MNLWDILILLAVASAVFLAVYRRRRDKNSGRGCCGSCEGCLRGTSCRQKTDHD